MIIALDYGHCLSGADTGAQGNGYKEQECTREIGTLVKTRLEALEHTVIEVAPDSASSVSSSLNARVNNSPRNADLFVSIHLNAGGGVGTEVFTYGARELQGARNILNNIVSLGFVNRGIKDGSKLYVVKGPSCPSMLIELCFIDTYSDMVKYAANKENLANAIVSGIIGSEFIPGESSYINAPKNECKLGWNQNSTGWWYCTDIANYCYYKDTWKLIDGEWYLFDSDGYAKHDTWTKYKDKWYYLKESCIMAKSHWIWIDGECYCFDQDGVMYENCITPDGYRVDEYGAWVK
ncbi:sporulation-specific N-acetylmuramoyl-L-alanine amidase [Clostridium puniceum]|uniref:Sporulation-specific N-acetylmuramoyl-L-alanine amidase n=1 Tax=Clostridium puniceum TaxID=29367 RepID=A0A1S8TW37_9CLOT|nr:N-acetylmuramoyl-L-alanine amidase [Clostridium puniceum]OOM81829.1 sporulation-specific N-acetylmuramoyl-L-alanine amidase [Clostridium puniceum]